MGSNPVRLQIHYGGNRDHVGGQLLADFVAKVGGNRWMSFGDR
jgi:hypothetical protein